MKEVIHDFVKRQLDGFDLTEDGFDRHGSFEWTMHRESDGLHRYVIVAVSPTADANFVVEVWAGASDGLHFARRLIGTQTMVGGWTEYGHMAEQVLQKPIDDAKQLAERLRKSDLDQSYVAGSSPL
ncbi:hypothetical protein QF034_001126 [Streptomyces africanus]|uniref:Uncharacterized protein n=1 Tax=Streptomyces africanus TaxID=231024 RepID=A0ABU0QIC9_9ACTN|nr:hypothetical protein [Streptomyces africanus]MDQ0746895.1 hypothetical protein [Streptomyces africanus]